MTSQVSAPVELASTSAHGFVVLQTGTVAYATALDWQRQLHAERVAETRGDTVLLLEHPSVYTAGRRTLPHERPTDGTPVVDTDRGGKITWHGPGQLVGYPIMRLSNPFDVVGYVRRIEAALMAACADFGVATMRVAGRSGVWIHRDGEDRKLAAIGVRVSRGITMHGFALNCDVDLAGFAAIVPCGISDAGVTSLSEECGRHISVADASTAVIDHLGDLHE